jgi:aspartate--ammonia ligase
VKTLPCTKYRAILIIGVGWPLEYGSPAEEVRSPGYDVWNLNGDIVVMHPLTEELSSVGICMDKDVLLKQLEHRGVSGEAKLDYHLSLKSGSRAVTAVVSAFHA